MYSWMNAQYASGLAQCEEALQIAVATDDPKLRILATLFLGSIHHALGNHRVAADLLKGIVEGPDSGLARQGLGTSVGPCTSESAAGS
jgi:hypothetical protein